VSTPSTTKNGEKGGWFGTVEDFIGSDKELILKKYSRWNIGKLRFCYRKLT